MNNRVPGLGLFMFGWAIVLQSAFVACDDSATNYCMFSCTSEVLQLKQCYAEQIHADVSEVLSSFIGSNECWDCDQVYNALSACSHPLSRRRRQAYNFTADVRRRWPSPISYIFDSNIPSSNSAGSDVKTIIRNALSHIQAQTCIRFNEIQQPLTTSYMNFTSASSCVSFVGRTLGSINAPIYAAPSCLSQFGQMLYLTVQTLGLFHETQRYDRDNYVTILSQNMFPENAGDLGIISPSLQLLETFGLPYDYASLMQFPSKIFSVNDNLTIATKDPLYQRTIGQRVQLSFQDTQLLNLMYCTGVCASSPLASVCQNGGYQDPNNCGKCHCPDGYSGTYCTELEPAQGAICGGELTVLATEQSITSPGYNTPGYYDSQLKCIWRLSASTGSRISLRFVDDFGIYCEDEACYHWVEVRYKDQLNVTGPRFCCNNVPPNLISVSNQALVIFQSNISGVVSSSRRGFQLAFSLLPSNPVASSPCDSNPCHNNGTCIANSSSSTGFTCTCPTPLSGPLCRQGSCGGCQVTAGRQQQPCVVNENPVRMCNFTTRRRDHSGDSSESEDCSEEERGHRRWRRSFNIIQLPCTRSFCCDNAQRIGSANAITACGVTGWSIDWTTCSAFVCGGGYQRMYYYSIQQQTSYNGQVSNQYVVTNTTSIVCNNQPCQSRCNGRQRWCRSKSVCNFGFSLQGSACLPTLQLG